LLSIRQIQNFLTTSCSLTTSELEIARDHLYALARVAVSNLPPQSQWRTITFEGLSAST